MAKIVRFSGFNESTLPSDILKKSIGNLNFGKKDDFFQTPVDGRKGVYDEDFFLTRNCRISTNRNNKGQVEVKIEFFIRDDRGYPSIILLSALGDGSDYNSAYLMAVESFIFQMPSIP
jgi:hypothetical protein